MPIINLTVKGKQAIGDGTKIVCMNSDYIVRIACDNCDTFVNSPVKKLVVRHNLAYKEAPTESVEEDGQTFLQAVLPLIERQESVELGVVGKDVDEPDVEPNFTSKPAMFECDKSVLCGVVVLQTDPKLTTLDVTENGIYRSADRESDGFYEVSVNVASKIAETRTVDLSMASGNQKIEPSGVNRTLDSVTITKPISLIPENIKRGINIGGVLGTYEQKLIEKEITSNGEHIPPAGTDGFSKVFVNINEYNIEKTLRIGESFTYDYDSYVDITVLPPSLVKYTDVDGIITFTAASIGSGLVTVKDLNSAGSIIKTSYYTIKVIEAEIAVVGTLDITENGVYDVTYKEKVNVNVGVPGGYIDEAVVAGSIAELDKILGVYE